MEKTTCHGLHRGLMGSRAPFQFKTHHLKTTSFHPPAGLEVSPNALSGALLVLRELPPA